MENILEKEAVQRVKKILNEFDKDLKVEILDNTARINILVDKSLSRFENIYAAAGHPHSIFKITYDQLLDLTEGKEEEIV